MTFNTCWFPHFQEEEKEVAIEWIEDKGDSDGVREKIPQDPHLEKAF